MVNLFFLEVIAFRALGLRAYGIMTGFIVVMGFPEA